MAIRVIVQTCDANMAAHVGGPVDTTFATFDIDAPALESYLRYTPNPGLRQVIGVELRPAEPTTPEGK